MFASLLMAGILLAPAPAADTKPQPETARTPVSWEDVRAAVSRSFCMESFELPDKRKVWSPIAGFREPCGAEDPATTVENAADRAVDEIRPVLVGMKIEGLDAAYEEGIEPEEKTSRVREAYLRSGEFLALLLPHLYSALDEAGLACEDCPSKLVKTPRHVPWEDLAPYVVAHAWPDDVVSLPPEDGASKGNWKYGLHFCAGINGISEMDSPDPGLTLAGFVAMFHTKAAHEIAVKHFQALIGEEEFKAITGNEARTQYLRRHLTEEMTADPDLEAAVCPTLTQYASDLSLIVDGCDSQE